LIRLLHAAVGLGHVDAEPISATWSRVRCSRRATHLSLWLYWSQYERLFLREVLQDASA